jgi:hypothetical protein
MTLTLRLAEMIRSSVSKFKGLTDVAVRQADQMQFSNRVGCLTR